MSLSETSTYRMAVLRSRVSRAYKIKMAQLLRQHDITTMQWSIIGLVSDAGDKGMRISDLANELDTSMAFITTTVNMLEAKGAVQKAGHERDSRAKVVRLSPDFAPKVKQIEQELHADITKWLEHLASEQDIDAYLRVLGVIAKSPV